VLLDDWSTIILPREFDGPSAQTIFQKPSTAELNVTYLKLLELVFVYSGPKAIRQNCLLLLNISAEEIQKI